MTISISDLEKWFEDRPKWLQDTARRLIQNGLLTEQDLTDLLNICIAEASGQLVAFSGIPSGALAVQEQTKPLRLESISDIQGINALNPGKPMEFGKDSLCIVYGQNGTGKSGYVRLLKNACGVRRPGELFTNIFNANHQAQDAKFTFIEDTQTKTSIWSGQPLQELRGVDIYDTVCGLEYVNDENEVAFEPWLLRLFSQLTRACEIVSQKIQNLIVLNVSKKPSIPAEYSMTSSAIWYANITASTPLMELDDKTNWMPVNETSMSEINKRLNETNPSIKAVTLRRQGTVIVNLLNDLKQYFKDISIEKCDVYLRTKAEAKAKRKAVNQDARKVFEQAPLAGIGSESWQLLWEAARKYSTEQAYKERPFPNVADDAHCVLCQCALDLESRDRFKAFEKFVKGELQNQAIQAEKTLQAIEAAFPDIPTADALTLKMDAAGITDSSVRVMVAEFSTTLANRKQSCRLAENLSEVTALPVCEVWTRLNALSVENDKQAVACDEDAKGQNRPELENKAKEMSARKWLHQQRKAIDVEQIRLATVQQLNAAKNLTDTIALSRRKSILTEELITNAYIQRFKAELKALKADHLPVELNKTRAEVGRVYHQIALQNAVKAVKTSDILSEGEFRIVSLAAFLADTEGRGAKTPFIFDDPISSLDQGYEEATAQRLIALSKIRQVIVFTHRLSLVGLLEKYAEKESLEKTIICLSRLRIGDIAELPITLTKTKPTANRFLNDRLRVAKTAYQTGDTEYEKEAGSLCRDIRILLEQIVETDLLAGVVRRFHPEVQTKNKIGHLAKITPEDCKFIDDMMTAYSRYEHSQSDETPIGLPKPDDIEKDLKAIISFIKTIQER